MAKLTVTITVLLLSLAISVASSKPENDIIADHLPTLAAEPDPDTPNPTLSGSESTSPDEVILPVNFVNFHPINRHFPRRPLTTALFNHRPCHHHRRRHEGLQIPYGNDMIFSGEEKVTDPLSGGVVVTDIKMLVGPFVSEETKDHPGREIDNSGEVEAEEDGSMKITVTRVKLIKRKEQGKDKRENTLRRKIRKFLNHLV
ncbi:unnamed protein product [Arabis nemorensis]|uniref:Uncharacterized protein n=1 Tax=Arabis nemorensis TaxID=586526 RepID=A0A565C7F2_9BRAS|nr:unnamed protein product [Arabis nemorensis]